MMHVRKTVYEKSNVVLEPEIMILPPDYHLDDNGPKISRNRVTIMDPGGAEGV